MCRKVAVASDSRTWSATEPTVTDFAVFQFVASKVSAVAVFTFRPAVPAAATDTVAVPLAGGAESFTS